VSEAASIIAHVTARPVRHVDVDRHSWVQGVIALGVPAAYGEILELLTETIASGRGSRPHRDIEKSDRNAADELR
jgi:hypothetical protein